MQILFLPFVPVLHNKNYYYSISRPVNHSVENLLIYGAISHLDINAGTKKTVSDNATITN